MIRAFCPDNSKLYEMAVSYLKFESEEWRFPVVNFLFQLYSLLRKYMLLLNKHVKYTTILISDNFFRK